VDRFDAGVPWKVVFGFSFGGVVGEGCFDLSRNRLDTRVVCEPVGALGK